MKSGAPNESILVVNFSARELSESAKIQIRREARVSEISEIHLACQFDLSKPLPPQIANVISLADKMARNAGFPDGLLTRIVVVPPGFADAAFIMGAWMAYANINVTSPIRTMRFSSGWTAMLFQPQPAFNNKR